MRVQLVLGLAVAAAGLMVHSASASDSLRGAPVGVELAQNALAPIPKPSDRRRGELEGWDTDAKPAAKPGARPVGRKAAVAAKAKPAQKAARDPDDGGLPLPRSRDDDAGSPVSFDKSGNIGTGFKF